MLIILFFLDEPLKLGSCQDVCDNVIFAMETFHNSNF